MEGKKQLIIEAAIKSFSEKGYRGTSIQDIADSLGIAKGSLYFYFKSKEDLLYSIIKYFLGQVEENMRAVFEDASLSPRDKLERQITDAYEQLEHHRSFIVLMMQERLDINEEMHNMFIRLKSSRLLYMYHAICEYYGPAAEPHAGDGAVIFHSLIEGYMGFVILERMEYDVRELSSFLMERLDQIMAGMGESRSGGLMDGGVVEQWKAKAFNGRERGKKKIIAEIEAIRGLLETSIADDEEAEDIESSLQMLEDEADKTNPQPIVVKGMLALLKGAKNAEIRKHVAKLESGFRELL